MNRRAALAAALVSLGMAALTACASVPAPPPGHVNRQIGEVMGDFDDIHLLVVSGEANRAAEIARIRAFLKANHVGREALREDDELDQLMHDRRKPMEPVNWVLDGDPGHTVCLITLDRSDYSQEGGLYWKQAWDVRDPNIRLRLDPVRVGNWNINHEMYHCLSAHLEYYPPVPESDQFGDLLFNEASADTFAALRHLQATGDTDFVRASAAMREFFAAEDTEHYTSDALNYLLAHPAQYGQAALRGLPPRRLAQMANQIVLRLWPQLKADAGRARDNERAAVAMQSQGRYRLLRLERRQMRRK